MPRPAPAVVKAKLAEIARRYASKRKRATKPQFAAIRVAELNRLFRARYGDVLPQDERGREAMWVVAQHLIQLSGVPLDRLMKWSSLAAPWLTVGEAVAVISDVAGHPMKWKADSLALSDSAGIAADRQALRNHNNQRHEFPECQQAKSQSVESSAETGNEQRRKAKRNQADKGFVATTGMVPYMVVTDLQGCLGFKPASKPVTPSSTPQQTS